METIIGLIEERKYLEWVKKGVLRGIAIRFDGSDIFYFLMINATHCEMVLRVIPSLL